MLEARAHASPGDCSATLDAHLPPADAAARWWTPTSPSSVASLYTERDGTRGRLLFVEEKPRGASIWDGRVPRGLGGLDPRGA
jgi:hypothetical protein